MNFVVSIVLWLAVELLVFLPLYLLGALVVPVLAAMHAWTLRPSKKYRDRLVYAWQGGWLTWIWGNEEDGVQGAEWYRIAHAKWSHSRLARNWFFRNPVNNLRYLPLVTVPLDARKIKYRGNCQHTQDIHKDGWSWFVCWQGVYANVFAARWVRGKLFYFRAGWKTEPKDTAGIPADDYRAGRGGIVFHLSLYKDIYG